MTRIAGRVAVVTGAGSGIGRALASALAARGATVAAADIDGDQASHTAASIGGRGFTVDVSAADSVAALAEAVRDQLGPAGILVNNAGVASLAALADMTDADWTWLLGVNLFGPIHGVAAFLPQLRAERGHVVNTGSMAGLVADAGAGGYGVTKSALTAYTEVLAKELSGDGIGVTLLAPGPVRTRLGSSSRNRPADSRGALQDKDLTTEDGDHLPWLDPDEVAGVAIRAIEDDRLYALTHAEWRDLVTARHRAIEQAFDGALSSP